MRALAVFIVLALAGIGAGRITADQLRGRYRIWPAWLVGLAPLAVFIVLAGWLLPVLEVVIVASILGLVATGLGHRLRTVRRRDTRPALDHAYKTADDLTVPLDEVLQAGWDRARGLRPDGQPQRPNPSTRTIQ